MPEAEKETAQVPFVILAQSISTGSNPAQAAVNLEINSTINNFSTVNPTAKLEMTQKEMLLLADMVLVMFSFVDQTLS